MDVKSAYLLPETREKLNFEQSMGFKKLDESKKKLVSRMNKSVYDLKRAVKNWYEELAKFLIEQNFVRSKNDYCFFSKNENDTNFLS